MFVPLFKHNLDGGRRASFVVHFSLQFLLHFKLRMLLYSFNLFVLILRCEIYTSLIHWSIYGCYIKGIIYVRLMYFSPFLDKVNIFVIIIRKPCTNLMLYVTYLLSEPES